MTSKVIRREVLVGAAAFAAALALPAKSALAATPKRHDVRINSFEFEPQHIEVNVGDMIVWTNEDLAPHTATADEGGWDTGEIVKNDHRSVTVTEGMETSYFCAFHPHMKGTIEVS